MTLRKEPIYTHRHEIVVPCYRNKNISTWEHSVPNPASHLRRTEGCIQRLEGWEQHTTKESLYVKLYVILGFTESLLVHTLKTTWLR